MEIKLKLALISTFKLIDEIDVCQLNIPWIRNQIGLVSSELCPLLDGTIAENIEYGSRLVSFDEVIHAADLAGIHEMIMGLPQDYHTMIANLDTKQQLLVSLARALIRKPQILLLDNLICDTEMVSFDSLDSKVIIIVFRKVS